MNTKVHKALNQDWWSRDITTLMRYADLIESALFASTRDMAQRFYEKKREQMIDRYGKLVMRGL